MELPGTILGYLVSTDPWNSMPGRLPRTILGIPGYLVSRINGTACLVGVPGTVLGILGYLVPCGQSGTSWICDTGLSYVSRDVQSRWAVLDIVELGKCCKIKG